MEEWRLIPLETVSAAWAMALEEVLVEGVASGGPPTIRFWRWDPSAATIGRFQDVDAEVDLEFCHLSDDDARRDEKKEGAPYQNFYPKPAHFCCAFLIGLVKQSVSYHAPPGVFKTSHEFSPFHRSRSGDDPTI